jgi:hypothetical protein
MSHPAHEPKRLPAADADPRPLDDEPDSAWDRVLDCGAPGPAHAEPALFYQAARRAPAGAEPPADR